MQTAGLGEFQAVHYNPRTLCIRNSVFTTKVTLYVESKKKLTWNSQVHYKAIKLKNPGGWVYSFQLHS